MPLITHFLIVTADITRLIPVMAVPAPPPVPLDGRVLKTTSDDLRSSVLNFDEVAAALRAVPERGRCYYEMWTSARPRVFSECRGGAGEVRDR